MTRCSLAILVALAAGACGDDATELGARGPCAAGGAITDCPNPELTPEAACEKLVACGVFDRASDGYNDYGGCVARLYGRGDEGTMNFVIACIAASSCDALTNDYCFEFGGN